MKHRRSGAPGFSSLAGSLVVILWTSGISGARVETNTRQAAGQPAAEEPSGDPALADAVLAGNGAEVRRLVEAGADIHGLDVRPQIAGRNGRRPLNWAALQNDTKMIDLLLELGADIDRQNRSGFTPLHHAVEAQAIEAIRLLLEKGADQTIRNERGLTAAEFALATGRTRAAEALGAVSVR